MIEFQTNADEVIQSLTNFQSDFINNMGNTIEKIAKRGKQIAQSLAPEKSGELKRGIYYQSYKKQMMAKIGSIVSSNFPYHFWINEEVGFTPLTWKRRNKFFIMGIPIRYGQDGNLTAKNNPVNWTGTRGYFNITAKIIELSIPEEIQVSVSKSVDKFNSGTL